MRPAVGGASLWWDAAVAGREGETGGRRTEAPRATAPASARSLLLTLLGEFVLPTDAPVWTAALVGGLAELGVEEKAARQALSRTSTEGLLVAERDGRRVRWRLTPAGTRLLREGTARIYGFGRGVRSWDGRWLVLTISVPEAQRQVRHRLRTRLTWAGLGSPLPGVWLTPDVRKQPEVAAIVTDLGVQAHSFVGPYGEIGEQQQVVDAAWELQEVDARYADFLSAFTDGAAASPAQAFRNQVQLVQQWRHFPFLDPDLPAPLLPPTWPGPEAARLFHTRREGWHRDAQAFWRLLGERADTRT